MTREKTGRLTVGRRPAGLRPGEKVSEYQQLTIRMPPEAKAELEATAAALKRPQWRIVIDAVRAYIGIGSTLTDDEKRVVRAVLRLHQ